MATDCKPQLLHTSYFNRQPMRIALLAHNLRVAGGLSVGINVIREVFRLAPQHEYLVFVPYQCDYESKAIPPERLDSVRVVPQFGFGRRGFFECFQLPHDVTAFEPNWILGLGNVGLRRPPCNQALLFHDSHLIYPETHYPMESWIYKFKKRLLKCRFAACARRSAVVFAQTRVAGERLQRVFGFPDEKLQLLPNAVSNFSLSEMPGKLPEALRPYKDRFKLFVLSKCYGHKNLDGILDVYERYPDRLADTVCIWTIASDQHPIAPSLLERIEGPPVKDRIVNVGPIPQEDLGTYFAAADALLFPTLLESFSGTYLEAMHYGCPILTSDLDFAHEICGDAALYVDPWNPASILDGIEALRDNAATRQHLAQKGRKRLKTFFKSWPDVVGEALNSLGIPMTE